MEFPQFRRFPTGSSYFCVHSASRITEIQKIGSYFVVHELHAKILPERNLIADLLSCANESYEAISAAEYEAFRSYCETELTEKAL